MRFDTTHSTAVFLGPSLERSEAVRILPANYYPPVRMGDVYRLTASGATRILILDGVFHTTASVWHREIMDALRNGIEVIGAASMGALRAAELHTFGMIGLGTVFEWYRDGVIDGDDEVALLHGDESMGYRPITVPLVNMRASASDDETIARLKGVCYTRRFAEATVDIKRADAIAALEYCAGHEPRPPASPDARLPSTPRWAYAGARAVMRGCLAPSGELVAAGAALDLLDATRTRELLEEAALHRFVLEWAHDHDVSGPPPEHRLDAPALGLTESELAEVAAADALVAHALAQEPDCVTAWAEERGITAPPGAELRAWMLEQGPTYFGCTRWSPDEAILNRLRMRGELPALLAEGAS